MDKNEVKRDIISALERNLGVSPAEADAFLIYKAAAISVKSILIKMRSEFKKKELKKICYLSMEFLIGKSLKNNL